MTFEDRQLTTQPGAKWIERDGKETYKVTVFVETSEEEDRQNLEAYHRAVSEYEAWAWSQPRPAPLIDPALCESRAPRMLPSRVKTRSPLQKIRTEGNVIYLGAPRPRGTTAL